MSVRATYQVAASSYKNTSPVTKSFATPGPGWLTSAPRSLSVLIENQDRQGLPTIMKGHDCSYSLPDEYFS